MDGRCGLGDFLRAAAKIKAFLTLKHGDVMDAMAVLHQEGQVLTNLLGTSQDEGSTTILNCCTPSTITNFIFTNITNIHVENAFRGIGLNHIESSIIIIIIIIIIIAVG